VGSVFMFLRCSLLPNVQLKDENLLFHGASHVTCNAFISSLDAGRIVFGVTLYNAHPWKIMPRA
jgi:hypothetical protein